MDVRTVSVAMAAIDVARHGSRADAVAAVDAALHMGVERDALWWISGRMLAYPGMDTARWAIEHGDPRVESPLESLGRLAFLGGNRRPPLSNVWVWKGRTAFRVDHLLLSERVAIEGDGNLRYDSRPDASSVVLAQRRRQELLERWGLRVVRYTWSDAWKRPTRLLARVDAAASASTRGPLECEISFDPPSWLRPWDRMDQLHDSGTSVTGVIDFVHAEGS